MIVLEYIFYFFIHSFTTHVYHLRRQNYKRNNNSASNAEIRKTVPTNMTIIAHVREYNRALCCASFRGAFQCLIILLRHQDIYLMSRPVALNMGHPSFFLSLKCDLQKVNMIKTFNNGCCFVHVQ